MPRRKAADPQPDATTPGTVPAQATEGETECAASECSNRFTPRRKDQRYCSATCRQRGARARKHAEAAAEVDAAAESGSGGAEHELVKAVREELGEAAGTVLGQLALQLARRMADPSVAGFSSLSKELRSLLAEAKAATQGAGDDGPPTPDPAEDDEVTRARRAREEARQAAGRS